MTTTTQKNGIRNGNATHAPPRKAQTPRSMLPKTVREASPKASRNNSDFDFGMLVTSTAQRKSSTGYSFGGRRGKQTLFAACCAEYKRKLNIEPEKHVPEETVKIIKTEIDRFWKTMLTRFETEYPETLTYRSNVPTVKWDKANAVEGFAWTATMRRAREAQSLGDERVGLRELERAMQARVDRMLENAAKYDRETINLAKAKLAGVQSRIVHLSKQIKK